MKAVQRNRNHFSNDVSMFFFSLQRKAQLRFLERFFKKENICCKNDPKSDFKNVGRLAANLRHFEEARSI